MITRTKEVFNSQARKVMLMILNLKEGETGVFMSLGMNYEIKAVKPKNGIEPSAVFIDEAKQS